MEGLGRDYFCRLDKAADSLASMGSPAGESCQRGLVRALIDQLKGKDGMRDALHENGIVRKPMQYLPLPHGLHLP